LVLFAALSCSTRYDQEVVFPCRRISAFHQTAPLWTSFGRILFSVISDEFSIAQFIVFVKVEKKTFSLAKRRGEIPCINTRA